MFVFSFLALLHCSGGLLSAGERELQTAECVAAARCCSRWRPSDHACDALFRYHILLKLTLVSFVMVEVLNLKQIKNILLKESKYHAESKIRQELSDCCSSHGSYTLNNKAFFFATEEPFWVPREPFSEQFLNEPFLFLVWRTFYRRK